MKNLLLTLFPSPVMIWDLEATELAVISAAIDQAEAQSQRHWDLGRHSVETSYNPQGVNDIIDLGIQPLADAIHQCQRRYFERLGSPPKDLKIVESWFNWYSVGGYMGDHEHPTCTVSGVYYHRAEEDTAGTLCFRNPNPVILNKLWPADVEGMEIVEIPPQPGRLVMFPSWMTHSVNRVENTKTSISFNMR